MAAFGLKAQSPEQESIKAKNIYVSFDFVKHLVFPVQVSDIEVGEKELISAERVEEAPLAFIITVSSGVTVMV